MKKFSRRARPTFAAVASLIAPENAPAWLPAFLEWWSQGIRYDLLMDRHQPTTSQTKQRLDEFLQAIHVIERELNSNLSLRYALEQTPLGRVKHPSLTIALHEWEKRAIALSASVTTKDGKAKSGRTRVAASGNIDARTLCAARIIEAWHYFHGEEPGPASLKAPRAAEAFWGAAGGIMSAAENPLKNWQRHFERVRNGKLDRRLIILRAKWRRDLADTHKRGGPPWFLGKYNPFKRP